MMSTRHRDRLHAYKPPPFIDELKDILKHKLPAHIDEGQLDYILMLVRAVYWGTAVFRQNSQSHTPDNLNKLAPVLKRLVQLIDLAPDDEPGRTPAEITFLRLVERIALLNTDAFGPPPSSNEPLEHLTMRRRRTEAVQLRLEETLRFLDIMQKAISQRVTAGRKKKHPDLIAAVEVIADFWKNALGQRFTVTFKSPAARLVIAVMKRIDASCRPEDIYREMQAVRTAATAVKGPKLRK
jgi:hypothetical protein